MGLESANFITSAGTAATQTVFHLHVHVVPRKPDDGLTLPWTGQKKGCPVPDYPPEAVMAARIAVERELISGRHFTIAPSGQCFTMAWGTDEALARAALDAAAPVLAQAVAAKILAHMEARGPRKPQGALEPVIDVGQRYRDWRRHFRIAAQVAANAFYTEADLMRLAAEALERGEDIGCGPPEVPP